MRDRTRASTSKSKSGAACRQREVFVSDEAMRNVKDGEWIRPVLYPEFYRMKCCECGTVHQMQFEIHPEQGLRMRGYREGASHDR